MRAPFVVPEMYCNDAECVEHSGAVIIAMCKRSIVCIDLECFVEPDALPWMMEMGEMGTEGMG